MSSTNDEDIRVLIATLSERFSALDAKVTYTERSLSDKMLKGEALASSERAEIKELFEELIKRVETKYVSRDQFWPVQTLIYGCVAFIGTTMMGAFLNMIIKAQ